MRFHVCWWNTGLAPPRGTRNERTHIEMVADTISVLMELRDVDLLCLGEVDLESFKLLEANLSTKRWVFEARPLSPTRVKFNMGFIYRRDAMELKESYFATQNVDERRRRASQELNVELSDGTTFHLFVVHWPSRIYLPSDNDVRPAMGQSIRARVDELLDAEIACKIIVLGDFNDEPFNDSVARKLSASRDLTMVQTNPRLLYNPFWKQLTPPELYNRGVVENTKTGSYYYRGDRVQRWRVFDQILVSSALLGLGDWHLIEPETIIWEFPELLGVGPGMSDKVDHLPVFAVLEKESKDV